MSQLDMFIAETRRRHRNHFVNTSASRAECSPMADGSKRLQAVLYAAGYGTPGHVGLEALKLVRRIAEDRGLKNWPDMTTVEDYNLMIAAVQEETAGRMMGGRMMGQE